MRQFKILGVAVAAALLMAACGGSDDDYVAPPPAIKYTSLVSFGDSLSDLGTYKVGTVAALGGGTYSVNGIPGAVGDTPTPSKNWTEIIAAQLALPAPCPAQTGLTGDPSKGFSVPITDHPGCTNYAQGGARVTDPVGPGSASAPVNSPLGQLTVPLVTQISRHLGHVGSFSGTELVTVMAGGNDVLRLLDDLVAKATAAGSAAFAKALVSGLVALVPNPADQPAAAVAIGTAVATAAAAPGATPTSIVTAAVTAASAQPGVVLPINPAPIVAAASAAAAAAGTAYAQNNGANEAVLPMGVAGKELATYIKSQIVGKGAKYVAVVNLPDLSSTPSANAQSAETRGLILNMAIYFNEVLAYELRAIPGVVVVDVFTESRNQIANPGAYGLTNVTATACDLTASKNALGSSLVCNTGNLMQGDVSKYLFADTVHPTPYGYKLLADLVNKSLKQAGWL